MRPCRCSLRTLKTFCCMAGLLLAGCISARRETAAANQASDAKLSVPRGWKTYTDPLHGFRISYPSDYKRASESLPEPRANLPCMEIGFPCPGEIRFQHRRLDAHIFIYASDEPFNLQKLVKLAPTGIEDPPQPVQAGGKTFYYYGAGGGGVCYGDSYFFNLRGKTLLVLFDGPCIDEKTPTEEIKALEPVVLASLRVF